MRAATALAALSAAREGPARNLTHGTNTLEEAAYFLDLTVGSAKPVILVGAQPPAGGWGCLCPRNSLPLRCTHGQMAFVGSVAR
jgi:L-asparaginase